MYFKDNSVVEFECESKQIDQGIIMHHHKEVEIFRVTGGKITVSLLRGSSTYDAYNGDYVVIKSSDIHGINKDLGGTVDFLRFPYSYHTSLAGYYIHSSFVIPACAFEADPVGKSILDASFDYLFAEYSANEKYSVKEEVVKSLCCSISSLLLKQYDRRRIAASSNKNNPMHISRNENISSETLEKFDKAVSYMRNNFKDPDMSLSLLSDISNINKTYLSALFPKLTASSFVKYLHNLRINHAIELMYSSEKNISEIAFSCGFDTIRSFNNVFKGLMGVTPSGFLSGLKGLEGGIDTFVDGIGKKIFSYKWFCDENAVLSNKHDDNCILSTCKNTENRLWNHVKLKMIFFAGQKYKVTYCAKALNNAIGEPPENKIIGCTVFFIDDVTNYPIHHPDYYEHRDLDDGWIKATAYFTVPGYYIPSTNDLFTIYSNPSGDLGVSFVFRDLKIVKIKEPQILINEQNLDI